MDVILQIAAGSPMALNVQQNLHHFAQSLSPQQIIELTPHALRCVDVKLSSPSQQQQINQLAYQNQIDIYWKQAKQHWSDFKLLAMDMDSTLITIECIDEIADMQGLKPQVAAITEAAMRGEIDFAQSLTQRVSLLKGLSINKLQQVYDKRLKLSVGAECMLQAVHSKGIKTLLVSGGFTYFTDRLKSRLKLDYSHANQLEVIDHQLTGQLSGPIIDAQGKRQAVESTCSQLGISTQQAIVIGDGANDLAMMEKAGLSVAFHAKPIVRAKADVAFNFIGLDGLLNLF